MSYKHLITQSKLDEVIERAEEDDNMDAPGIRNMYWLPEEAVGEVIKWHMHWGYTFCEVVDVDVDDETITLSELFTDREFTTDFEKSLDKPFIGSEYTVEWIEAKVDGEWERVSDYATPDDPMGPYIKSGEEYDNVRVVEKSYTYGAEKYYSWPIRVDRQTGEPGTVPEKESMTDPDLYDRLMDSIELPEDFDLNGMQVGTLYTDEHVIETDDGVEKQYEIVWWTIDSAFQPSHTRLSPVTEIDRRSTA